MDVNTPKPGDFGDADMEVVEMGAHQNLFILCVFFVTKNLLCLTSKKVRANLAIVLKMGC